MVQQDTLNNVADQEFLLAGHHVHKLVKYIGILNIVGSLILILIELFGKNYAISLDGIFGVLTAGLLLYGQIKERRYFYVFFWIDTVINFVGISFYTFWMTGHAALCTFNPASGYCKGTALGYVLIGLIMLLIGFVEGLSGYIVMRGFQYLKRKQNEPLPSLSFQNPTMEV
ncbi:hypothetical protein M3Y97_00976500 [Aphelenchoides bicaudatus]|nr:hypothetical protein M3Y97_00976500 [Aphelenchoides bicaudatus]